MRLEGIHNLTHSEEERGRYLEQVGESTLTDGYARVRLRPDFVALIDTEHYYVFVIPLDRAAGVLVVEDRLAGCFTVRQLGGTENVRFQYRVIARRLSMADL